MYGRGSRRAWASVFPEQTLGRGFIPEAGCWEIGDIGLVVIDVTGRRLAGSYPVGWRQVSERLIYLLSGRQAYSDSVE